jgi:hypothetical protein
LGEDGQRVIVTKDWQGFQRSETKERKKMEEFWDDRRVLREHWASIVGFFGGLFGGAPRSDAIPVAAG